MLDIDPGLDTKLRAFFDHIEASAPPSALTDIAETTPVRGRRTLNLFAGIAAATVIAASVALFAVELRGHEGAPSPAGTSAPAKPSASVSPYTCAIPQSSRTILTCAASCPQRVLSSDFCAWHGASSAAITA